MRAYLRPDSWVFRTVPKGKLMNRSIPATRGLMALLLLGSLPFTSLGQAAAAAGPLALADGTAPRVPPLDWKNRHPGIGLKQPAMKPS